MNATVIVILGIFFIFLMTTLGSAVVFLFKKEVSNKCNSLFFGFASGLMIAASIWSLIIPSIEGASNYGNWAFVPAAVSVMLGGLFLVLIDKLLAVINNKKEPYLSKSSKLFLAVTLHNIPEGLAVGLSFGSAFVVGTQSALYGALILAIGIGIQNFPEGSAISLPMLKQTQNKFKSFLFGMLSGIVEPIMAVIGFFLSTQLTSLMPWFLAFSAGAMLFVVAEELIPEAKLSEKSSIGSWGFLIGFVLMMALDVALG